MRTIVYFPQVYIDDTPEPPCCLALYPGGGRELTVAMDDMVANQDLASLGVTDPDAADDNFAFKFRIISVIANDDNATSYFR